MIADDASCASLPVYRRVRRGLPGKVHVMHPLASDSVAHVISCSWRPGKKGVRQDACKFIFANSLVLDLHTDQDHQSKEKRRGGCSPCGWRGRGSHRSCGRALDSKVCDGSVSMCHSSVFGFGKTMVTSNPSNNTPQPRCIFTKRVRTTA